MCARRDNPLSGGPSEFSRLSVSLGDHPGNNLDCPSFLGEGHPARIIAHAWETTQLQHFWLKSTARLSESHQPWNKRSVQDFFIISGRNFLDSGRRIKTTFGAKHYYSAVFAEIRCCVEFFSVNNPQFWFQTLGSIAQLEQLLRAHVHALGTMQERPQQTTNGANQRRKAQMGKTGKNYKRFT
jgi:hypothetical protein